MKLRITPSKHLKSQNENLESIIEMKEIEELVLIDQLIFLFVRYFKKPIKSDVSFILMEITKISDRVDALENKSKFDESEETKSVGAVNIEFTGDHLFQKITKEGFHFDEKVCLKFNLGEHCYEQYLMINENLLQLEASVESLMKNASVDKTKVSEQMNEIKSSVALVKTGLTSKINHLAVSHSPI